MINLPLVAMFIGGAVVGGLGVDWWRDRRASKLKSVFQPGPREFSDTPFDADDVERKKAEVQAWMMRRKLEAGLIAKECLDEILHARNACETVFQVVKNLTDVAGSLAELVGIGDIVEVIKSSNANDKEISQKLKGASAIGKMAATSLVPAIEKLQEVKTLLQSTGWLSDYPPVDSKSIVKTPAVLDSATSNLELDLGELDEPEISVQASCLSGESELSKVLETITAEELVKERPVEERPVLNVPAERVSLGLDISELDDEDESEEMDDDGDQSSEPQLTAKQRKKLLRKQRREAERLAAAELDQSTLFKGDA